MARKRLGMLVLDHKEVNCFTSQLSWNRSLTADLGDPEQRHCEKTHVYCSKPQVCGNLLYTNRKLMRKATRSCSVSAISFSSPTEDTNQSFIPSISFICSFVILDSSLKCSPQRVVTLKSSLCLNVRR